MAMKLNGVTFWCGVRQSYWWSCMFTGRCPTRWWAPSISIDFSGSWNCLASLTTYSVQHRALGEKKILLHYVSEHSLTMTRPWSIETTEFRELTEQGDDLLNTDHFSLFLSSFPPPPPFICASYTHISCLGAGVACLLAVSASSDVWFLLASTTSFCRSIWWCYVSLESQPNTFTADTAKHTGSNSPLH